MTEEVDVLLTLPEEARDAFKEPLGPIETDVDILLDAVEGMLITVGDVVTYHCERAGRTPDVALVDGRTNREAIEPCVKSVLAASDARRIRAVNPAGTITASLVKALQEAIANPAAVQIGVDGEEDLATIPAIMQAPASASVVYGQPGAGMVHVSVSPATRDAVEQLLEHMEGDHKRLETIIAA